MTTDLRSTQFLYEHADIPAGVTLAEWRKSRRVPLLNRRRWWLPFSGWKA